MTSCSHVNAWQLLRCSVLIFVLVVALPLRAGQSEAEAMVANLLGDSTAAPAPTSTPVTALAPEMLQPLGPTAGAVTLATNADVVVVSGAEGEGAEEPEVAIDTAVDLKEVVTEAIRSGVTDETAEVGIFPSAPAGVTGALAAAGVATTTTPEYLEIPLEAVPLKTYLRPGTIVGNIRDHNGRPVANAKVVLFNDTVYKTMQSTPGGNFAFNILASNEYTLTAAIANQFFYTNMYLVPGQAVLVRVQFRMPITVYGQLLLDGQPAQYGLFMRLINPQGAQAGAVVMSNGYFRIARLTPDRYTLVLERRKMFTDRRIDETRFYYVPVTLTSQTARIRIERDRRTLHGIITIDGLPRTHVDAIVILKDARTNGRLIYREAPTYYQEGRFVFPNVQPGTYVLQAVQRQRQWIAEPHAVTIQPNDRAPRTRINVVLDKDAERKRLEQLRKQFMPR